MCSKAPTKESSCHDDHQRKRCDSRCTAPVSSTRRRGAEVGEATLFLDSGLLEAKAKRK